MLMLARMFLTILLTSIRWSRLEVGQNVRLMTSCSPVMPVIWLRKILTERGIIPENLPAAEAVKKVERRLASEEKKMLKNKK